MNEQILLTAPLHPNAKRQEYFMKHGDLSVRIPLAVLFIVATIFQRPVDARLTNPQSCPSEICPYTCTASPDHGSTGIPPASPILYSVLFGIPQNGCGDELCRSCGACTVATSVSFQGNGLGCIVVDTGFGWTPPRNSYVRNGALTTLCNGTPAFLVVRFGDCSALPYTWDYEEYYILTCPCGV